MLDKKGAKIYSRLCREKKQRKKNKKLKKMRSLLDKGVPREKLKIRNLELFKDGVKVEIEANSTLSRKI